MISGATIRPMTPFSQNEELDPLRIQPHEEWVWNQGIAGMFLMDTSEGLICPTDAGHRVKQRLVLADFLRKSKEALAEKLTTCGPS